MVTADGLSARSRAARRKLSCEAARSKAEQRRQRRDRPQRKSGMVEW